MDRLNNTDIDIMRTLWKSNEPLLVSEIVKVDESLSIPTVQRRLKQLLKKGYIEVADVVQSGKVLARRYRAKKTSDDFLKEEFSDLLPTIGNKTAFSTGIISALINDAEDDESVIIELENFIEEQKNKIQE